MQIALNTVSSESTIGNAIANEAINRHVEASQTGAFTSTEAVNKQTASVIATTDQEANFQARGDFPVKRDNAYYAKRRIMRKRMMQEGT